MGGLAFNLKTEISRCLSSFSCAGSLALGLVLALLFCMMGSGQVFSCAALQMTSAKTTSIWPVTVPIWRAPHWANAWNFRLTICLIFTNVSDWTCTSGNSIITTRTETCAILQTWRVTWEMTRERVGRRGVLPRMRCPPWGAPPGWLHALIARDSSCSRSCIVEWALPLGHSLLTPQKSRCLKSPGLGFGHIPKPGKPWGMLSMSLA